VLTGCVVHTKYAPPHCRGGEAGVTQGLRTSLSCSVQPSHVHEREKPQGCSVSFPRTYAFILAPFLTERHVLSKGSRQVMSQCLLDCIRYFSLPFASFLFFLKEFASRSLSHSFLLTSSVQSKGGDRTEQVLLTQHSGLSPVYYSCFVSCCDFELTFDPSL
jgi:hypothetical protein